MSWVQKKGNSKFWHGFWRDADGVTHGASTSEVNRGRAVLVAARWEEASRHKRSAVQARKVMARIYKDVLAEGGGHGIAVGEYVRLWLKRKKGTVAGSTWEFYRGTMSGWLMWMGTRAAEPMDSIGSEVMLDFRNEEGARVSAKTANHRLKALRSLFSDAVMEGYVADDPMRLVKNLKSVSVPKGTFSREQIGKVLGVADEEWRGMILFALYTGQSLKDVALAEWTKIDLRWGKWSIHRTKTGRVSHVRLHGDFVKVLGERKRKGMNGADGKYVHPRSAGLVISGGGRVGALSNQFTRILELAGLRERRRHDVSMGIGRRGRREVHGLSFHSFRHTTNTWLVEAGVPPGVVREFMGHASAQMTAHYSHAGEAALSAAAGKLPGIDELMSGTAGN